MTMFEQRMVPNVYQGIWEDDNSSDEECCNVNWQHNATTRAHDEHCCSNGTLISMGAMVAASAAFGCDKQAQVTWQPNYLCPASYSLGESATPLIPMEAALRAKIESRRQSDDTTTDSFDLGAESEDDEVNLKLNRRLVLELEEETLETPEPQHESPMQQQQQQQQRDSPGCMHLTMSDRLSMDAFKSIHDSLWCGREMEEE